MDNGASSYRRFLSGDNDALVEIIRDYKDGLMYFLNGFVNDLTVAEELMEDTFVRLYTKKPRYSEKSSFKTWLYGIGRNVAREYLHRERKSRNISGGGISKGGQLVVTASRGAADYRK